MKTADFDYVLPPELIAQHPCARRDGSRMMVLHRAGQTIEHRLFLDLPAYLRSGDLMVFNNTRVIPARLFGQKSESGGKVELLFLEEVEKNVWDCLLRSRRRPAIGGKICLPDGTSSAYLVAEGELGRARVRIESDRPLLDLLEEFGEPPLPPYVQRPEARGQMSEDKERYQTVYAKQPGAVAAPTAGLHFTPEVLARLRGAGVESAEVTLHVGLGTFRPVTAETVEDHTMEAERYEVPVATARNVIETKSRGSRVVAIGSTAVRTLETVATELPILGKNLECAREACAFPGRSEASSTQGRSFASALQGRSSIFIYPPYPFRVVDAMLTNFHLPKSTLIMMISAFAGRDFVMQAYAEAIREKYRFYSYGDCMLIL